MSDLRITHTDSDLTTWVDLEGNTFGITSWGVILDDEGREFGTLQQAIIGAYLENNGFTAAAKAFASGEVA